VDRLLSWRAVASAEAGEDDVKTNRQMRKTLYALSAKRCSISNIGGKPYSLYQRVEDNAFHLTKVDRFVRRRSQKSIAEGARFTRISPSSG
jgi:hypothetical protein